MNAKTLSIPITPVESSQIHGLGHDAATNTLAVQFKAKNGPGSVYHYAGVTAKQFEDFLAAESIGKHFGAHFKKNDKHPFTKIVAGESE